MAKWIAGLENPPLLVISSDMNHFADDTENRRRDALALEALERNDPQGLLQICQEENISMCGQLPAALILLTLKALGRQVQAALGSGGFDVAVVYSGAMDPLVQGFRPRVLDLVDVDSAKFAAYHRQGTVRGARRLAFGLEGRRLQRLEQDAVQEADLSLVCTAAEAAVLRRFAHPRRLEVLSNGVDTEAFPFQGDAGREAVAAAGPAQAGSPGTGSPDRDRQLVDFVTSLTPRLQQVLSDSLFIYGRSPAQAPPPARRLVGPETAPVRITEWTDVLCEHCADLHATLLALRANLPPGSFSVDSRQFPLDGTCNPLLQPREGESVRCLAAKARI